ncbi:NmrA/HSCARG family protein [Aspergillus stella-maris]|uniref:NmrA/HSCARG family protein n=1 Tax=Aspergillus stella-maris TaxID=1810926 RepID=UPI003CCD0883
MSSTASPTFFVCGASGTQGGAITTHLLETNARIHAIARNPSSERNRALAAAGVTVFPGSYDDEDSLRNAMKGCTGLFLNLSPSFTDGNQELAQAKRIIFIANEAGIGQVIYSSGLIQNAEKSHYWDSSSFVANVVLSKKAIEDVVRRAGFRHYTILRPGNFMANYLAPYIHPMYPGLADKGEYNTAFTRDTVIPMVDPFDIGAFGAAAFSDPQRFHGKEIALASQLMTLDEVLGSISTFTSRDLKATYMSEEEISAQKGSNPFLSGQLMMRNMADGVDMDEVKSWGIPLTGFERFLKREEERVKKTFST